jgi:hypothetical protein
MCCRQTTREEGVKLSSNTKGIYSELAAIIAARIRHFFNDFIARDFTMKRTNRGRGAGPLSPPQKTWFSNGTGTHSNSSADRVQAPSATAEPSIVDIDFSGVAPGRCSACQRDFAPTELVYFGWRVGYPARVGECCRPVLDRIVLRETRWRQ